MEGSRSVWTMLWVSAHSGLQCKVLFPKDKEKKITEPKSTKTKELRMSSYMKANFPKAWRPERLLSHQEHWLLLQGPRFDYQHPHRSSPKCLKLHFQRIQCFVWPLWALLAHGAWHTSRENTHACINKCIPNKTNRQRARGFGTRKWAQRVKAPVARLNTWVELPAPT